MHDPPAPPSQPSPRSPYPHRLQPPVPSGLLSRSARCLIVSARVAEGPSLSCGPPPELRPCPARAPVSAQLRNGALKRARVDPVVLVGNTADRLQVAPHLHGALRHLGQIGVSKPRLADRPFQLAAQQGIAAAPPELRQDARPVDCHPL